MARLAAREAEYVPTLPDLQGCLGFQVTRLVSRSHGCFRGSIEE